MHAFTELHLENRCNTVQPVNEILFNCQLTKRYIIVKQEENERNKSQLLDLGVDQFIFLT